MIMRTSFPQVRYRFNRKYNFIKHILVQMKQKTETWLLLVILLHSQLTTMHVKKITISKLDSCDDGLGGDSPLIVDVEEAVASIPGDILDPPSDLTRAPAATVASPESVSEGAPTPESLETAESSVVSLCQVLQLSHHSLLH